MKMPALLAIVAVVLILLTVGTMDYDDQQAEFDLYCQNVDSGIWPDYRGVFESGCSGGGHD